MHQKPLTLRIIGFVTSLILTLAAYLIVIRPGSFHLSVKSAIVIIFILAVCQSIAQFLFFLNIWREKGPRWNLSAFISTILIVLTIIFFTIWIMGHLEYNMMP